MNEIYSEASSIIAWLGVEDESSRRIFHIMEEVRRNRSSIEAFENGREYLESKEARDVSFARPYWSRVWVVQEIAMNTMLWVQCGPRKTL